MKAITIVLLMIIMFGIAFNGCDQTQSPTSSQVSSQIVAKQGLLAPSAIATTSFPQSVVLNGFTVAYNGRTLSGGNSTFTYTVSGPGVDMHFRLELPACAGVLLGASPSNGQTTNNDASINPGIEWHPSVGSGSTNSFTFSVTYSGLIREGIVLSAVKSGNATEVGRITGACARVFDISGFVFTDANNNSTRDGSETGIIGASVNLRDASNVLVGTLITDANGKYLFEAQPEGSYTVSVDTNSLAATTTTYVGLTTPSFRSVSIGPDSPQNNFGFSPKTNKLINDLKFGLLPTNGKTSGYWKKQLQVAISGTGKADYNATQMLLFLNQVAGLQLPDPFTFPGGLQSALDIFSKPVRTELDGLRQQLLATEFNHVAGRGIITTDPALQLVLIGWGEALVASSTVVSPVGGITTMAAASSTELATATRVFSGISSGGGGGGDN